MDVYDTGRWELLDESSSGSFTFRLHGGRLRGTYTLASARLEGEERNWLLIRRDGQERRCREYEPMHPTVRAGVPSGQWLYEVAWNGERAVARLHEGDIYAPALPDAIAKRLGRAVRVFDCVLDGEVSGVEGELHYYVHDLLELEGEPLLSRPLVERRAPARAAPRPDGEGGAAVGDVRGRFAATRARPRARARRYRREASRLALRSGRAQRRLGRRATGREA